MKKIILASSSPRRKEFFSKLRLPFEIHHSDYEEDMTLDMPPVELAKFLSLGKAESVAVKNSDAIIIAADTFVVFENKFLGKPKSETEAKEMLKMLSGKENDIVTGVTIIDPQTKIQVSFHDTTKVFIQELSDEIIDNYIKTGEPMDKAGAYAIQELGAILIERIEGDMFNAMGLPLRRLVKELEKFGVKVL
jgi:septum formation protein